MLGGKELCPSPSWEERSKKYGWEFGYTKLFSRVNGTTSTATIKPYLTHRLMSRLISRCAMTVCPKFEMVMPKATSPVITRRKSGLSLSNKIRKTRTVAAKKIYVSISELNTSCAADAPNTEAMSRAYNEL